MGLFIADIMKVLNGGADSSAWKKDKVERDFEKFCEYLVVTKQHTYGGKSPKVNFMAGGVWFSYLPKKREIHKAEARGGCWFSRAQKMFRNI